MSLRVCAQGIGKIRIAGQLIDAVSGATIWAERFERDADVFALQDEVTVAVVSSHSAKVASNRN
jgi:adenylate cyclase